VLREAFAAEDEDVDVLKHDDDVDASVDWVEQEEEEKLVIVKSPKKHKASPKKSPPRPPVKSKSIKLILEPREDLALLPSGYDTQHRYGGRLTCEQADISMTTPLVKDRRRFQASQHEVIFPFVILTF
jgi:hypothetical protein